MNLKYKRGRIIGTTTGHGFDIGKEVIVLIGNLPETSGYDAIGVDMYRELDIWYVGENDVEFV